MKAADFFAYIYVASGLVGLLWIGVFILNIVGLVDVPIWPSILIVSTILMIAAKIVARQLYLRSDNG